MIVSDAAYDVEQGVGARIRPSASRPVEFMLLFLYLTGNDSVVDNRAD